MKLLLDTHTLLWWMSDDDRLGRTARDLIADPANAILVSVVSLWEIVVKVRIGKLEADVEEISIACDAGGLARLDITTPHLRTLMKLGMHHRDPFDHLLIAQAIAEAATFISDDPHAAAYGVTTMTCSGAS